MARPKIYQKLSHLVLTIDEVTMKLLEDAKLKNKIDSYSSFLRNCAQEKFGIPSTTILEAEIYAEDQRNQARKNKLQILKELEEKEKRIGPKLDALNQYRVKDVALACGGHDNFIRMAMIYFKLTEEEAEVLLERYKGIIKWSPKDI
jgi:hypothetical protein